MNTALYNRVLTSIEQHNMLTARDSVAIAVSGGPDSVFLLRSLYALRKKLKIDIYVVNIDHGLRGISSRDDSAFVKDAAKELGIRYLSKKLKFNKDSARKISVEEFLRLKRYEFFKEAAKKLGANTLATGHTLDDQAETVLMRVIKGATIKGLSGISPAGKHGRLKIVRPLIEIEKAEILSFLKSNGIRYRTDRTNRDEHYFRNKVRRKILPYLEQYNPRIKRSLALMAESLREDREFIEDTYIRIDSARDSAGHISIKLKDIVVQPKSLQREIMRDALTRSGANIKKLNFRHWRDLREFMKHKRAGQSIDLPGGVAVWRTANELKIKRRILSK